MAYKASLPLRLFQYAIWAIMILVAIWFFILPVFLRATAPEASLTIPASPVAAPAPTP